MKTNGYGGKRLNKNITVYTDDEKQPLLTFTISGNVENFVTVTPNRVYLTGIAGTKISRTVSIRPAEKYPFKIIKTKAVNGEYISYKLEEDKSEKVKIYFLTIENLKTDKGSYFDMVDLETDSKIQPHIKIGVNGNIRSREEAEGDRRSQPAGERK